MSRSVSRPRKAPSAAAVILPIVLAGALSCAGGVRAADWVERPYDPPVGSRWIIQLDTSTEDERSDHVQKTARAMTSDMTVEEKLADGFRVTYVVRKAAYQGDTRTAALVEPLNKVFENLIIRATIGANGAPLHIDNLDEVDTAVHAAIDRSAAALPSKPEADALQRLAKQMFVADEKQAPKIYLSALATLALGQNTGLHPGETRREVGEAPNPFGGAPIKSNTTLTIDSADPATGKVRFLRTAAFDPDAIRDFLGKLARRLGIGEAQKLDDLLGQFAIALDSRTEIEVEDGMTRSIRQDDTANATFQDQTTVKRAHKLMTVAPAP